MRLSPSKLFLAPPAVQIKTEPPEFDPNPPDEFIDVHDQPIARTEFLDEKMLTSHLNESDNKIKRNYSMKNEKDSTINNNFSTQNKNHISGGSCNKGDECEHKCTKCGTKFSNRDSVLRHLLLGCVKVKTEHPRWRNISCVNNKHPRWRNLVCVNTTEHPRWRNLAI